MESTEFISLVRAIAAGVAVAAITLFFRWYLYSYIHKVSSKTKTCFDDIFVHETRLPTLLWSIWLGIYAGYKIATTPEAWIDTENMIMAVLFAVLVVYTAINVLIAILKWYGNEICPKTVGKLDDIIITILITSLPIVGAILGTIWILGLLGLENPAINIWLSQHLASLAVLTLISIVLLLSLMVIVPRLIRKAVISAKEELSEQETQQRVDTLVNVIITALQITIIFVYVVMVLSEFTFNITAILTGAGVLGLAVGFGAQSLVKDLIAGLFVIMENQYRTGDVVKIAGVAGGVVSINLRRTVLRDLDGIIHVIPNGEIRVASNYTKQFSRVNLNISVSYATDLEKAMALINRVGKELAADPIWETAIVSPPRALRVDKLGDSGIEIKVLGDTKPMKQWEVTGELRLRLKKAFDQEGIEIPWPHTKVFFGNTPRDNKAQKDVSDELL